MVTDAVKMTINSSNPAVIANKYIENWKKDKAELQENLDKNLASLNEHKEYLDPEIAVLEEYEIQAEMILKLANWEVNFLRRLITFFDDATLIYFRYQSIA